MSAEDTLSRFLAKKPKISEGVFIALSAVVVGDVRLGKNSSVWYNTVLRADINYISIGEETNIQDGVIGHLANELPLLVGKQVTVGHGAVIHACTIEDECLIGMNATVLDGARIGKQSIVAAGAVVPVGTQVPDGSLVAGVPGRIKRTLTDSQRSSLAGWAEKYLEVSKAHQSLGYQKYD